MSGVPTTTRVYLVRHCDVRNPDGVIYGHLPDFPLSEKGVQQAHRIGEGFAKSPARIIYTSPLERAVETATIIASHINREIPIVATDELIEAKFGIYLQGVRYADIPRKRPLWFIHRMRRGLLRSDESVATMATRTRLPILRILRDFPGEGGICVSHGDPIQAFWTDSSGGRRFDRLECDKGGQLPLDYTGTELVATTYRPPPAVG